MAAPMTSMKDLLILNGWIQGTASPPLAKLAGMLIGKLCTLAAILVSALQAQSYPIFEKKFKAVMSRAEYRHSRFGVEFYSLEDGKVLYAWNPQELFVPGSTTKILSVGTALELLGPDFRF